MAGTVGGEGPASVHAAALVVRGVDGRVRAGHPGHPTRTAVLRSAIAGGRDRAVRGTLFARRLEQHAVEAHRAHAQAARAMRARQDVRARAGRGRGYARSGCRRA